MCEKIAVIFIGIQASGKTTFYNKYFSDYVHVNLDTLKRRSRENTLLTKCIENGESFVVDNTNPTKEVRQKYFDFLKDTDYEIHGYFFKSSIEDCLKRNKKGKAELAFLMMVSNQLMQNWSFQDTMKDLTDYIMWLLTVTVLVYPNGMNRLMQYFRSEHVLIALKQVFL